MEGSFDPSLLHHTFLLGPARFTALRKSALIERVRLALSDQLRMCNGTDFRFGKTLNFRRSFN